MVDQKPKFAKVEDTFCEAFEGLFSRFLITAKNERWLKRALCQVTALPSTVFDKSEGGVEKLLPEEETPDGRVGAIVQVWVTATKDALKKMAREVGWRIRQGVLVVPTTSVFNAWPSETKIDTMPIIGHCGDGYEFIEEVYGRKMINIPIMMPEFRIERYLGVGKGVMGGNLWFMCRSLDDGLEAGERAINAISKVDGAVTPFHVCAAGSKPETKYPEIGPTTNHRFCPTLKGKIPDSMVPENVESIPEIVIDGVSLNSVKAAMKAAIDAVIGMDGVVKISAGNYGGKLGKYKIGLRELSL
ncbi:formylmethanofuran--tetrahydromethanopterin N-formyltransferase [Candidatus Bathyarchaeota archaeon]|nr:formylmethanofuran--tetrahydromethanopterin N-formyltransferase [Candidatus Bathyarchaeota archaeon]